MFQCFFLLFENPVGVLDLFLALGELDDSGSHDDLSSVVPV